MDNSSYKKIINDYYSSLQHAFKTGVLSSEKLHLADDVKVIVPNERFEGKATVESMLKELVKVVDHYDIQRIYYDHEGACVVMDCVVKLPPYHIATIEWFLIKNGKIAELHPVYDTLAWEKLMNNLKTP